MPDPRDSTTTWLAAGAVIALLGFLLAACGADGEPGGDDLASGSPVSAGAEITAAPPTMTPELLPAATPPEVQTPSAAPAESDAIDNRDVRVEPSPSPELPADQPDATTEPGPEPEEQPDEAVEPAPALGTIDEWHNSEPLTLDQLVGQPVLLVFWADY